MPVSIDFSTSVPLSGYSIQRGEPTLYQALGTASDMWGEFGWRIKPKEGPRGYRRARPDRECSTLFLEFADLAEAEPEDFVPLADRFGPLLRERSYIAGNWRETARSLNFIWELAHFVDHASTEDISRVFRHGSPGEGSLYGAAMPALWYVWRPFTGRWSPPPPSTAFGGFVAENCPWWPLHRLSAPANSDIRNVAEGAVHDLVNERIRQAAVPELGIDEETGDRVLCVAAHDLAGLLYLQLARAIVERREFKRCCVCKKHFEITRRTRGQRDYCSTSCKLKASRARKKESELLDPGLTD